MGDGAAEGVFGQRLCAQRRALEEYEAFRTEQLNEPTEVERHFVEAEQELKQINSLREKDFKGAEQS
jgi:hypothetical protein